MTQFTLGINNCFAVKRWPEPERWSRLVREELGLDLVQHTLDLADLTLDGAGRREEAMRVKAACAAAGLTLHSTFTGLSAYSYNLLLDPDPRRRESAEAWFRRAVEYSAAAGAAGTGGHVGSYSSADRHDAGRRERLSTELRERLGRLAEASRAAGLATFYVENMASALEPSTMAEVDALLCDEDEGRAAIRLCLDVGHMCTPGTAGEERDPYRWLRRFGPLAPVIHLQQSDAEGDHHWPFTPEFNRRGRIEASGVLDALEASGTTRVCLVLEVIPPFEADEALVIDQLAASVEHWRTAVAERRP